MKKSEFKKLFKKEYPQAKKYAFWAIIAGLIFLVLAFGTVCLQLLELYPLALAIFFDFLIISLAIAAIIMDVKNDLEIKKAYKHYQEKQKFLSYTNKMPKLKLFIILELTLLAVIGTTSIGIHIHNVKSLIFTTVNNKVIETDYVKFEGYKLKIPKDFETISEETIAIKYPNEGAPRLVYSNSSITINIAFSQNNTPLANEDVKEYTETMKKTLNSYSSKVEAEYEEIQGHTVGHLKLITEAVDTSIFNHMILFSVDDKAHIISFNCLESQMTEWEAVSDFILGSLKFR